jgi:PAS domain S-box-containing protein
MRFSDRDRFIFRAAAAYAALAAIWFLISGQIAALFPSRDSFVTIDGALDVGFVVVTTVLLIIALRRVPLTAPYAVAPKRRALNVIWYALAVTLSLATVWIRLSLDPTLGTEPGLILFVIPISISAYLGGLGPGLAATAVSSAVSSYLLLAPMGSWHIDSPLALVQWLVLVGAGALLSATFEALQRSRNQAQNIGALQSSIVSSSQDAIYSVSVEGKVMSCNPAAEELFGFKANEMIGSDISILSPPGLAKDMRELNDRLARGEVVRLMRTQRQRRDGSVVEISISASPVMDGDGKIIGSSRIARDIGDLVRAEKIQQNQLATMRAFIEQAPIMIAMLDRNLNYLAASKLWSAEYGSGRTDLVGQNHYTALGNVTSEWKETNRRALAGETIRNDKDYWIRPDGTTRWLRSVVQPWIDAEGKIGGLIIFDDDYTERKKAEDALRESEERFAAIFRESPIGIVIFDLRDHCRLIDFNDTWLRIMGFTRGDVANMTGFDLDLWPDPAIRQAMYDQLAKPATVWHAETQMRRKDGTLIDTALTMRQIEIGGRPLGLALVYDDSARKRLERELRSTSRQLAAFIDASPIAIIGVDAADYIMTWNPAAAEIFGFTATEAVGRRFQDLVPIAPEDAALLEERSRRRARGEVTRSLPSRRRRKDGTWAKLSVSAGNLTDESGAISGAILVVEDVTDREKLREQLTQAQKMEAIGQLTGGVAHDFNNLLTVILGSLELLQENPGAGEQQRRWLESAIGAGRGGADLVHRLLAFSRRQPLEPVSTDVNDRISHFAPLLRRTLGEAIEIRQKLGDAVWPVMVDAAQFDSALLNLAVNARDAMPEGGWIEIASENVVVDELYASQNPGLTAGEFVRVSVSDSGHGMTPEVAARVFEPFFTTKETGTGTGLGLSMVYGFIKQSGGYVSIYSEPELGTVVKLLLPRAAAAAVEPKRVPPSQAPAATAGSGETILVVEDDPDVRVVSVQFLRRLGYQVLDTDRTQEALALLSDHPEVVLLFTDIVLMGGETGVALAAQAKVLRPDLKILFASGYSEEALERNRHLGAEHILLHKPFNRAELATKVREALGLQSSAPGK